MAAFIQVTDSLTGEPVAVNMDLVETMRTRNTENGSTTILDFGRNFVQCTESMRRIGIIAMQASHPRN